MFRTVVINAGERLSVRENRLTVEIAEEERQIPLEDIYSVVVDNRNCSLTVPCITALTEAGAHILLCDEKHIPVTVILPENRHYHPLSVIRRQMASTPAFKNSLWNRVVTHKIINQANVMELCGCDSGRVGRMRSLALEVTDGDEGNREGIAAKFFFRSLYGAEFIRMSDDATNAALNYGYTVLRSAVCKTLCAYGFNCVLGIHHINESNPFNLADDLMEPLRPVVDRWTAENEEELFGPLTKGQRNDLAALLNCAVLFGNKKMRLRNALDGYIKSFSTAVERNGAKYVVFPEIIRDDHHFED